MGDAINLLITLLAWLAPPVILVCLYDHFVLAKQRRQAVVARDGAQGKPPAAPGYVRAAQSLLPFTLIALVLHIGVALVFGWLKTVAVPLSWLALPVGLWLAIDSWFLSPRRQVAKGVAEADPPLIRAAYFVLPALVLAVIVRMISAESLDFSLVLLMLSVVTGLVWLIDHLFVRPNREKAVLKGAGAETKVPEPGTVDYARSFFPVAFIVLLVRSFVFEPFRIPSDSMMPTLLDGDFIVVNKYAYGLRWPVLNEKFVPIGEPQRGDVVVFRFPDNPNINYIKRLVGLPGDRVAVHDDQLVINGQTVPLVTQGRYTDGCYVDVRLSEEVLGEHRHQVMSCRSREGLRPAYTADLSQIPGAPPICNRKKLREDYGAWICRETPPGGGRDSNEYEETVVPPGHFLMIGDNRDNSQDGRSWGFVPEKNLVGKATRIWFNFDTQRDKGHVINWSRIGNGIQ
jgi:signal peptidase I